LDFFFPFFFFLSSISFIYNIKLYIYSFTSKKLKYYAFVSQVSF
jgi:hypothetical protein